MSTLPQINQPSRKNYGARLGNRTIYGIMQPDGQCLILADCNLYPDACIKFTVPGEAAATYFEVPRQERPPMHHLFPGLRPEHREILISGVSPAEFDQLGGRPMPATEDEFQIKYGPLGYTFDE